MHLNHFVFSLTQIPYLWHLYRYAIRCAKFGVVVLKASMLNWGVSICYGYMCIVLYMKLLWCYGFAEIYAQLEEGETYVV